MPVLVDGLQEVAVPDVLLAPAACQQGRGDLQDLIHWLPGKKTCIRDNLGMGTRGEPSLWAEQDSFSLETGERTGLHIQRPDGRGAQLAWVRTGESEAFHPRCYGKKCQWLCTPAPSPAPFWALCPLLFLFLFFHPPFLLSFSLLPFLLLFPPSRPRLKGPTEPHRRHSRLEELPASEPTTRRAQNLQVPC